jgi:hypothetical protein
MRCNVERPRATSSHRSCLVARSARHASRLGIAAGALLSVSPEAHANCSIPPASIVWSSPAEGAVDVPIDADLLLVTESVYLPIAQITLVGEGTERVLEAGSALPNHFDLGELAADRAYTVVIEQGNEQGTSSVELHFTTGQRRAPSVEGEVLLRSVSRHLSSESPAPEFCNAVLYADTCYDTGLPGLYAFDVDANPSPVGAESLWMMHLTFRDPEPGVDYGLEFKPWPAACGIPIAYSGDPFQYEYRIYNIGEGGVVRTSNGVLGEPDPDHELAPEPEPPAPPRPISASEWHDRGCNLSPRRAPSSPAPVWLGVSSALALLVRRARAASSSPR